MLAEIYTKDNCQYCTKAKAFFDKHKIDYVEHDIPTNRDDMFERIKKAANIVPRTAPQIFIDNNYIGGYDDLVVWFKTQT